LGQVGLGQIDDFALYNRRIAVKIPLTPLDWLNFGSFFSSVSFTCAAASGERFGNGEEERERETAKLYAKIGQLTPYRRTASRTSVLRSNGISWPGG
jgi:hypothetical protein